VIGLFYRRAIRVAWIPILCMALTGGLAYLLAGSSAPEYRSTLLVVIPSTPSAGEATDTSESTTTTVDPIGRPTETLRLAGIYAELIPNDTATLSTVAEATDQSVGDVRGNVAAVVLPDSSLIRLTFTAPSPEQSEAGRDALERALIGFEPVTSAIPGGALVFVSADGPTTVSDSSDLIVPSAVVLGLGLGVFLAVVWSRSVPHADGVEDLDGETEVPVVALDAETVQNDVIAVSRSLLQRHDRRELDLGLVATSNRAVGVVGSIALRWPEEGVETPVRVGRSTTTKQVLLHGGGPIDTPQGLAVAVETDAVVLGVLAGDRMEQVRRSIESLARLDVPLIAVLYIGQRAAVRVTAGIDKRSKPPDDRPLPSEGGDEPADSGVA
jgi:hypothetical protein